MASRQIQYQGATARDEGMMSQRLFGREISTNVLENSIMLKHKKVPRPNRPRGNTLYDDSTHDLKRTVSRSVTVASISLPQNQNNSVSAANSSLPAIVGVTNSHNVSQVNSFCHLSQNVQLIQATHDINPKDTREYRDQGPLRPENILPAGNKQVVPEYFSDCLKFMLAQEKANHSMTNYFRGSAELMVTESMRQILIEWLVDMHFRFKLFPSTLYIAVNILDQFIAGNPGMISKENLQLVGAAAFSIAAKYEETYNVPKISELIAASANCFTRNDLIATESAILRFFNFQLIFETPVRFLEAILQLVNLDEKNIYLSHYISELALLNPEFLGQKPSLVALSTVYLVCRMRKKMALWPEGIFEWMGYDERQVKAVGRDLCALIENVERNPYTKVLRKKYSNPKYHQVSKIRLERK